MIVGSWPELALYWLVNGPTGPLGAIACRIRTNPSISEDAEANELRVRQKLNFLQAKSPAKVLKP